MDKLPFMLEVWTLNQTYNKIKNCRVVKPPYELDWSYSQEFFFDKRFGLIPYFSDPLKKFLDCTDIKGIRYYLYREGAKHYIGTYNGTWNIITTGWFTVDANSPIRLATGRGGYGASKGIGTIGNTSILTFNIATTYSIWNLVMYSWIAYEAIIWSTWSTPPSANWKIYTQVTLDLDSWSTFTDLPGYTGGYVKFRYTGGGTPVAWDYITFKDGVLKWGTNKIMKVTAEYIYIIGTNARGSMPAIGTTFEVFSSIWTTLLVGHATGVSMAILNGHSAAKLVTVLSSTEPIIDVVNFDGSIFAMTESHVYFSRAKFDDNVQFYPLDNFPVDGGYKLFPIGKAMLVFARQNKLIAAANATGTTIGYVMYDANYNGDLYSKYSLIFADQTIYLFQTDKQLMQVDLVQNNNTSFNVVVKNILTQNRGKFEDLSGGEVLINVSDRYINFLYINNWDTINIQYDKQYTHWIEHEYSNKLIYSYGPWAWILSDGHIFTEGWYLDNIVPYNQEIHFSVNGNDTIYMPYMIRTLFGMLPNHLVDILEPRWDFDVTLDITLDLWGKLKTISRALNNFNFDSRLNQDLSGDELIGFSDTLNTGLDYNGNVVSIQTPIYKTWRYTYFKYTSSKRFIIGHNYVFVEKTKPFINEMDLNN